MVKDARFEDGGEKALRLKALEAEELPVIPLWHEDVVAVHAIQDVVAPQAAQKITAIERLGEIASAGACMQRVR